MRGEERDVILERGTESAKVIQCVTVVSIWEGHLLSEWLRTRWLRVPFHRHCRFCQCKIPRCSIKINGVSNQFLMLQIQVWTWFSWSSMMLCIKLQACAPSASLQGLPQLRVPAPPLAQPPTPRPSPCLCPHPRSHPGPSAESDRSASMSTRHTT